MLDKNFWHIIIEAQEKGGDAEDRVAFGPYLDWREVEADYKKLARIAKIIISKPRNKDIE